MMNKSNKPRSAGLPAITLILLSLILLTTGCDVPPANPTDGVYPTVVSATTSSDTFSDMGPADDSIVSGTLRLWMPRQQSYNPLTNDDVQYNYVCNLMYQSLYVSDGQGVLVPELADGHGVWDTDGLIYTVKLRTDARFSNQTPVTAGYYLELFSYIARQESSPYKSSLDIVQSVEAPNESTLVFTLKQRDPFFAYRLLLPICDVTVGDLDGGPPPGSGRYAPVEKKDDGGLILEQNEQWGDGPKGKIETIDVRIYENYEAALQAFSSDELDLVPLPSSSYSEMIRRQNISVRAYDSLNYYFVNYNIDRKDPPFPTEDDLLYIKQILTSAALATDVVEASLVGQAPYPIHPSLAGNASVFGASATESDSATDFTWSSDKRSLLIIYLHGDKIAETIAETAVRKLAMAGVRAEGNALYADTYEERLADGVYDIAVCDLHLGSNPDPGWMYGRVSEYAPKGAGALSQLAFDSYSRATDELAEFEVIKSESPLDVPQYYELVSACERVAPFTGVGFAYEGLMIGPRVRGNIGSHALNPYAKIEELWIWSGQ